MTEGEADAILQAEAGRFRMICSACKTVQSPQLIDVMPECPARTKLLECIRAKQPEAFVESPALAFVRQFIVDHADCLDKLGAG